MSGTCIAKSLTVERNNIVIIPSWMYQQHQKTRTIYKAESSNPKVLSLGVSLLYRVGRIHPHYWPVSLLTQLYPEAKPAQSVHLKEWSRHNSPSTWATDNPKPKGERIPCTDCTLAPQQGALACPYFSKVLFPDQGQFCFSKRELISHLLDFKWFKINKTTHQFIFPSLAACKKYLTLCVLTQIHHLKACSSTLFRLTGQLWVFFWVISGIFVCNWAVLEWPQHS